MRNSMLGLGLVLVMALMLGCSDAGQKVYKVTGKVTLKGQPVADARLTFAPVDEKKEGAQAAAGKTDANGVYTLVSTVNDKDSGALPGQYKVAISKKYIDGNPSEEEQEEMRKKALESGGLTSFKQKESLPKEYTSLGTTPLTATVEEKEENVIDFQLK